ncbi:hypothetical protein [Pseudomonas savastanoi]|uniref:hypothetical protein n=1 Tax=Pseudomonas savastanoi TaxID=29438 RepID=UPI000E3268EB|nr:hypothetical protein [Pseudomonas savastanoi]
MASFYVYFNGTCIDVVEHSTARKARNFVNRGYKSPEQCVVVEESGDVSAAIELSKKLYVADKAFEAEVASVMADAELTGAARERSGKTICFSENIRKGTHGIQVLTDSGKWDVLLEGVTLDKARDFMRNFALYFIQTGQAKASGNQHTWIFIGVEGGVNCSPFTGYPTCNGRAPWRYEPACKTCNGDGFVPDSN